MRKSINVLLMAVSFSLVVLCMGCESLPDFSNFPKPTTEGDSTSPAPVKPSTEPAQPESDIIKNAIETHSPEWFRNVPEKPGYIYAVALDHNRASSTAMINAKIKAHSKISMKVKERYRAFLAEAGVDPDESVSRMTIVGSQTVEIKKVKEEKRFYIYVLMRISEENVKASIVAMVKADENLHAKLKESPKFRELMEEAKVADVEEL